MDFHAIDTALFFFINQGLANSVFDAIIPFITTRGYLFFAPYAVYVLLKAFKGDRKKLVPLASAAFIFAVAAVLLGDWFAAEIKKQIARVRPCNVLEGVHLLVGCTKSASMPSNHATNAFAAATALFFFTREFVTGPVRWYPFAIAAVIAFSRPYVGVHYPADVLAGALFGSGTAYALWVIYGAGRRWYETHPHATVLGSVLAALTLVRIFYILNGPLDLSPDEAHYWEWARRLDLSYYSKGPVIAYLIAAGTWLFGDTVWGVRCFAPLFSVLGSIVLYDLVGRMYSPLDTHDGQATLRARDIALGSAILLQIFPMFAPFGVLLTIDSPFLFLWILALACFWRAAEEPIGAKPLLSWILVGVVVGIGLLTKYTMAFFIASGFLFLLFTKKRKLLLTPYPYMALLISLIVFSPVVLWNMQHDWVTVRHTAGQAHIAAGMQISLKTFGEFLGSQIIIVTPVLFVLMVIALCRRRMPGADLQHQFLFWFAVPIIVFFLLKSVQGKVQPNWAMTGYVTALVAVCGSFWFWLGRSAETSLRNRRVFVTGALLALIVTTFAHIVPATTWLPVKMDPSQRLRGWKQIGAEVGRLRAELASQGSVLIFSDSYQVASELAFYVTGRPVTYCINNGRRMNQYDFWPDMNAAAGQARSAGAVNGIYVRIGPGEPPELVLKAFQRVEKKVITVYDKGRTLREYGVFLCYGFRGLAQEPPKTY
ncbi:MAG TPA: glycosyltransferase family 39 protein [Dissulfurispiraceae bacterium]|nr:glycosyltransferase family 39 protein [Dissulfurispiraceae bacterium]